MFVLYRQFPHEVIGSVFPRQTRSCTCVHFCAVGLLSMCKNCSFKPMYMCKITELPGPCMSVLFCNRLFTWIKFQWEIWTRCFTFLRLVLVSNLSRALYHKEYILCMDNYPLAQLHPFDRFSFRIHVRYFATVCYVRAITKITTLPLLAYMKFSHCPFLGEVKIFNNDLPIDYIW